MALCEEELEELTGAFSGQGIEEQSIISFLGRAQLEHKQAFRQGCPDLFVEDEERKFERWNDDRFKLLKREFMRFKNAVVLCAMHPWERDAHLLKQGIKKRAYGLIVEVACTRSSDELLGARKAYHALFDHSVEEDVASKIDGSERKLLVALVSAYRYEGPKVKEETARAESKLLARAIEDADNKGLEDDEVVRVLSTRSKAHLQALYAHYEDITGQKLNEDLDEDSTLRATVECLCNPKAYFCKVLYLAMDPEADKRTKKALARVIVTQAESGMAEISEEFENLYEASLYDKIAEVTKGNYRELLLALLAKGSE